MYIKHFDFDLTCDVTGDTEVINPRLTGVSAKCHWPGEGGGGRITPTQANSQTNDRSETGEVALERSRRDGSKALLKFS